MRKTKRVYANYAFFDRTGIQTFLEKQALKGWMLCGKKASMWHFHRMEPKKLHYSVTYFPGGSEVDAEPSEELRELLDFCEHTGWKQAVNGGVMQIFYHDAENPTPIETDALVELDTIHKAVKKEYVNPRIHLLCVCLLYLSNIFSMSCEELASYVDLLLHTYWLLITVWFSFEIGLYYVWRRKALKAAETDGSFVETHSRPFISSALGITSYAAGILALFLMTGRLAPFIMIVLGIGIAGILWARKSLSKKPEEDETPLKANLSMVVTVLGIMVLPMALFAVVLGIVLFQDEQNDVRAVSTYEYQGNQYKVFADEIPLTIEDLMDIDYTDYSYEEMDRDGTFLVEYYQARQQPRQDTPEQPELRYRVVTVKADFLYDFCKNDMLDYMGDGQWVDSEPWGAESVYHSRRTDSSTPIRYLLCYPNCIVELRMDWIPTTEQMELIGAAFE